MSLKKSAPAETPAHPLYPAEQVFLWLPGFAGKDRPYCTYNATSRTAATPGVTLYEPDQLHDANGAFLSPLFPINPGTYICWHLHDSPPIPYHGVPVIRSLSREEMDELALRVLLSADEDPNLYPDPRVLLRNNLKCFILVCLAEMGMLSAGIAHRKEMETKRITIASSG